MVITAIRASNSVVGSETGRVGAVNVRRFACRSCLLKFPESVRLPLAGVPGLGSSVCVGVAGVLGGDDVEFVLLVSIGIDVVEAPADCEVELLLPPNGITETGMSNTFLNDDKMSLLSFAFETLLRSNVSVATSAL